MQTTTVRYANDDNPLLLEEIRPQMAERGRGQKYRVRITLKQRRIIKRGVPYCSIVASIADCTIYSCSRSSFVRERQEGDSGLLIQYVYEIKNNRTSNIIRRHLASQQSSLSKSTSLLLLFWLLWLLYGSCFVYHDDDVNEATAKQ